MTIRQFVKEHRKEIDGVIAKALGCEVHEIPYRNDEERRIWLDNDEGLYNWARSEGVRI